MTIPQILTRLFLSTLCPTAFLFSLTSSFAVELYVTSPSFNTSEPTDSDIPGWSSGWGSPNVTGWDYIGQINGASGVYLGNGWVITAAHVGMGSFSLDGVNYPDVANSQISFGSADICLFRLASSPDLPPLSIATSSTPTGLVVMTGYGGGVGETWGPNQIVNNWDNAPIAQYTTNDFYTCPQFWGDAYLVDGDSGGGDFVFNSSSNTWQLAGINEAVDGYDDSDMVNLGTYPIEQAIDAQAIPEPGSLTLLSSGALLCLAAVKLKSMKLPASAT